MRRKMFSGLLNHPRPPLRIAYRSGKVHQPVGGDPPVCPDPMPIAAVDAASGEHQGVLRQESHIKHEDVARHHVVVVLDEVV